MCPLPPKTPPTSLLEFNIIEYCSKICKVLEGKENSSIRLTFRHSSAFEEQDRLICNHSQTLCSMDRTLGHAVPG